MIRHTCHLSNLDLSAYDFGDLPKGEMVSISMNPYTGKVFLKVGKNELSAVFALSLMKSIVTACAVLERDGIDDPLRVLMGMTVEQVEELQEVEKERNRKKVKSIGAAVVKAS